MQLNEAQFFGKQGLACSKRRSRKLRARPKNRAEGGKFGEAKPVPAVAFLCFLSLATQRKEVPRAGIRRNGEQGRCEEGYLKFGKPPEPQPFRMLCGLSLAKSLIKNTLRL